MLKSVPGALDRVKNFRLLLGVMSVAIFRVGKDGISRSIFHNLIELETKFTSIFI